MRARKLAPTMVEVSSSAMMAGPLMAAARRHVEAPIDRHCDEPAEGGIIDAALAARLGGGAAWRTWPARFGFAGFEDTVTDQVMASAS